MKAGEFVTAIRRRARFNSVDAALRASRATLMTLGERLAGDAPRHLAQQLPPEIAQYLLSKDMGKGERLSAQEFLRRISVREGVDLETARAHARAVVEVLYETVTEAEMRILLPHAARVLKGSQTRH
jgi:uncharacterized protein (DUF2267 family)